MKSVQLLKQKLFSTLRNSTCNLRFPASRVNPQAQKTTFHHSPLLKLLSRHSQRSSGQHLFGKRFHSTKPPPSSHPAAHPPESSLSLSQRFRKLSREYGWSALGVYLALSALDFPFCFLAVRWLGTDRIGHWEHVVLEWFWKVVPYPFPARMVDPEVAIEGADNKVGEHRGLDTLQNEEMGLAGYDHGVKEAEKQNRGENASIWTQLALAYAIHKSFIFIRIPITAAVTPKVVKVLRGWGWDIGKRRPKGIQSGKKA